MSESENSVSPQETITRYLFSERLYAATRGRVKYPAFLPRNGETSVFRIDNIRDEEIWDLGDEVGNKGGRALRARGDLISSNVFDEGLEIKPDRSEHSLHANIVGWPSQKGKIILLATSLAEKAKLKLKPSHELP